MLTEKDYCDLDTSVELKKMGIPLTSCGVIKHPMKLTTLVPLYVAQKWLREKKNIEVNTFYDNTDACWRFYILEIDSPDLSGTYAYKDAFMSYEDTLLEGIKEAIKILKEKK